MALKISISSYVSGGYTNPVIYRLYETGTGVFVDDHQELGPHGQVYNFSWVNNIKDIVYTVKMYEQPGGTGTGTLIKSEDITVSTSTVTFDADIETIVDGGQPEDPTSGTSVSPVVAALVGKDYYVVQRGVGQRRVTRAPEITIDPTGFYTLLNDETFNPSDTFIIKIRPQFVINPAGSAGGNTYSNITNITGDTTISSTDFGKLLVIDGNVPVVTIQLPAIASLIEKVPLFVESVGTSHHYVVFKAAIGETITATGTTSNTFILGRATGARIIKVGSTIYGFTDDVDIKKRGQMEWGYYVGVNRLAADGTEYVTADYPGLKKAMDAMPAGEVVNYTTWNLSQSIPYLFGDNATADDQVLENKTVFPNKGFYSLSDDGTHFRVPDLRNKFIRALKFVDGTSDTERLTQMAGGYQVDQFKKHTHLVGRHDTSRGPGGSGTEVYDFRDVENHLTSGTGLTETRGENNGQIPLIIL